MPVVVCDMWMATGIISLQEIIYIRPKVENILTKD